MCTVHTLGGRLLIGSVALVCLFTSFARGATPGETRSKPFPAIRLPRNTRGEAAILALGQRLDEIARAHGKDTETFRQLLLQDRTLGIDRTGRLHYTDDALPAEALPMDEAPRQATAAPYPLTDTFRLHSRRTARRTLYLDFDGHVLSGTAWNTSFTGGADIVAPPFDIDGNPAAFSEAEQTRIQQIWQRVAEDFAPFNIDVTTELTSEDLLTRSSASDMVFGIRVLISPISHLFGNYGGIAYVGVFDDIGDTHKPVLVFPERLAHSEKYIGEAVAHEAGHALGLDHDGSAAGAYFAGHGTGATGWAPIMGNAYVRSVTQWSKGEYAGANNRQDDLAVMLTRGLEPCIDDHGNTPATATHLPISTTISASGLIGLKDDVDVLAIVVGSGPATITVSPASPAPNLDLAITLTDSEGVTIGTAQPANQLGGTIQAIVPAGTCYLHIRGDGNGSALSGGYSAYGSLGRYVVTVTVPSPTPAAPTNLRVAL